MPYEPQVAATVIGLAGFQILEAWNRNAPTLDELRSASPDDVSIQQRLMDADFMVGGIALLMGASFAAISHDYTALLIMLVMFGSISLWFHSVQKADSR